ncbi:MAG TPA: helix-turn-helix domain-containing protein [Kofleriaceae bacterium]|nr:helix-turn-helix domain-containing protein [Kofleriaceae bacterium]
MCRMFGVSRPTGYTWIERYREANNDLTAVNEKSRRPKTSPTAISPELEDLIVEMRKRHPRWGPRKLHAILVQRNPSAYVPSASVMAKVLKRRGMTTIRRRRRSVAMNITPPFKGCTSSNDVWCIDFKGWFVTQDQVKCYPLMLIDAFSRYLLRCEALTEPDGKHFDACQN